MKKDREQEAEEKVFDFWLKTIRESDRNHKFYRAGVQWMIDYWHKKLIN